MSLASIKRMKTEETLWCCYLRHQVESGQIVEVAQILISIDIDINQTDKNGWNNTRMSLCEPEPV